MLTKQIKNAINAKWAFSFTVYLLKSNCEKIVNYKIVNRSNMLKGACTMRIAFLKRNNLLCFVNICMIKHPFWNSTSLYPNTENLVLPQKRYDAAGVDLIDPTNTAAYRLISGRPKGVGVFRPRVKGGAGCKRSRSAIR